MVPDDVKTATAEKAADLVAKCAFVKRVSDVWTRWRKEGLQYLAGVEDVKADESDEAVFVEADSFLKLARAFSSRMFGQPTNGRGNGLPILRFIHHGKLLRSSQDASEQIELLATRIGETVEVQLSEGSGHLFRLRCKMKEMLEEDVATIAKLLADRVSPSARSQLAVSHEMCLNAISETGHIEGDSRSTPSRS